MNKRDLDKIWKYIMDNLGVYNKCNKTVMIKKLLNDDIKSMYLFIGRLAGMELISPAEHAALSDLIKTYND